MRQPDHADRTSRRAARRHLLRTLLICLLLVVAYYLIPVEPDVARSRLVVRSVLAALALALITVLVVRLVVRLVREEPGTGAASLLVALVGGVALFALIDYVVAISDQEQFSGLRTKTDALYFTVTTLATVGYGDVHAAGQLARAVVTVQQVYNLVVITTGATVLVRKLTSRARP